MNLELRNIKGSKVFLPKEQLVRYKIRRVLEETFQKYGYQPMETPILNYFELLASKYGGGAEILKEVYQLTDQGKRELGLRYDLTVPFAKMVGMNPYLSTPFKRYEIGKVFRDGPVKTGRMREFIQCDVDVVGVKSMMAEAELLSMVVEVFEKLSMDVYIQYNNRKLLSGILLGIGIVEEQIADVILMLDKVEKIGRTEVGNQLREKGISDKRIDEIFQVLSVEEDSFEFYLNQFDNALVQEGVKEIQELNEYLEALDIIDQVKFNPFLSRGLNIYTGTVYETFLKDGSITSSLAAGGRYDKIIGDFLANGKEYPVVGLSFGLDVIYSALEMKQDDEIESQVDLYVIPLGTEKEALKLANQLRKNEIAVDIQMEGRRLKKSLDYANRNNIPYVIILGENELRAGKVMVKNMFTGDEIEVSLLKEIVDTDRINLEELLKN